MRILITNDDSIKSENLIPLVLWAKRLGEVSVFVPKHEQSGKSHGIEIKHPYEIKQVRLLPDTVTYRVDSTPADCVRYAVLGREEQYDLVISGINNGYNVGEDIVYSGTVGAVFEAACLGIKAVAVSTDFDSSDSALEALDKVYGYFTENRLFDYNRIYNVNIPPVYSGIRITKQGNKYYRDAFVHKGDDMFAPHGTVVYRDSSNPDFDTDAVRQGYISITPLALGRTEQSVFASLSKLNK